MPSKHSPEDQKLIDSVSMGVMTAFRSSIYQPRFIKDNSHLWVDTDWIDVVQLRRFLSDTPGRMSPSLLPLESASGRVKVESDALNALLRPSFLVPEVKVRTWMEEGKDFIEILSDSEDAPDNPDVRQSSPFLPSDVSSSSTWDTAADAASSASDDICQNDSGSAAADDPDKSSSEASHHQDRLQESDLKWLDRNLSSRVSIGELQVTAELIVQRVEYLTDLPSLYPIPETPTAFVVDLQDPKFNILKKGALCTPDALIKNKGNDSWEGNTGTGDSRVCVTFESGANPILCRRSHLKCKGAFACEQVDSRLPDTVRRDLDNTSRDAVFAAQRQTRRDEGTTGEHRFIRGQKCPAMTNGVRCKGVPILRTKKQISRLHKFWIGCSGYDVRSTGRHNKWPIPDDVDESIFVRGFSGEPLVADNSKDTSPCSAIVHPTTGLKQRTCPHDHIINGRAVISTIMNHPCTAKRTIFVPVDASIRKALITHGKNNFAHNHPMPMLKKAAFEVQNSYRQCIKASGCVAATVAKVDNAPSTQVLLGMKPGEFSPALHSKKIKQRLVCEAKVEKYPAGLGPAGAFQLFFDDLESGVNERYLQRVVTMPDGGIMILTCLTALMKLLDDPGVTSFETDTTFSRVEGDINEWEVVLFLKALQRAVTIARAYVNGASTQFYKRLFDEFQSVKKELTGKPVAFKRFIKGGNILALNSDMEGAQVLGAAHSFLKTNVSEYSGISYDTPPEKVAPEFIKLCTTHAKRAVLDFWGLVTDDEYRCLMDFIYIDSDEKIQEFSEFVSNLGVKKIQDWWDHKAMSAWILPCLIKSQSPMSSENWDKTPSTTNTGEGQHHWANSQTGTKLTLVEAIETWDHFPFSNIARKVDEAVAREIETSIESGILLNTRNESIHRRARNTTRAATTMRKSHDAHQLADERAQIQMEIEVEQEIRNASAVRLKELKARKSAARTTLPVTNHRGRRTVVIGSSSSGRVTTRMIASSPLPACGISLTSSVDIRASCSRELGDSSTGRVDICAACSHELAAGAVADYDMNSNQYFPNTHSNFDFNTFNNHNVGNDPAWPGVRNDLAWLDSLTFNPVPAASNAEDHTPIFGGDTAQFFTESSSPQLPPIPRSPSPPAISTIIEPSSDSTTSKKRKTRDEVDPTNVVQGTRTRKAPKRYDL
ncbi:hypothetical protein C8R45DRAFT_1033722 [Mycena sanguinolenta]|nr:hypothetical protein C8R45DRAFT_1033722 [Mycena sanguinolenta]